MDRETTPTYAERLKAAADLVGKRVRFAGQGSMQPCKVIAAHNDMVELEGWTGFFAPHIFVITED